MFFLKPIAVTFVSAQMVLISCVSCSWANHDLGQLGKVYPVIERDMTEVIKEKIEEKQKSGVFNALNEDLVNKGRAYVSRPNGTQLPRAKEYRAFLIDPTYTLERDIHNGDGQLLFKKGYSFNPLAIKPMTKTLCFIDGDDEQQVEWLQQYCGSGNEFKNILTNGDYQQTFKKTGFRLYFDQGGYLAAKFRIAGLPAVVRQSGNHLYVEEYGI